MYSVYTGMKYDGNNFNIWLLIDTTHKKNYV